MKISVPQAGIGKASAQQLGIGEVKLGPVQVGQLTLKNLQFHTDTGEVQLRNVRVVLTLKFALDWTVGIVIDVPPPFSDIDISAKDTMDLGTMTLGIGFGNLTLPGLAQLSLDIPSLAVPDLSMIIGTLRNLNLGAALVEQIKAQGLAMPAGGFQVGGLGLAGFSATGIGVPDATLAQATIGRITGGTLPLEGLSIPGITLPQLKLPRVSCHDANATSNPVVTKMPQADAGLLKATLKVTTTARFQIDELRIEGVKATASVGEIALHNIELPYEILNLSLSQIGIESIQVPQVEVN